MNIIKSGLLRILTQMHLTRALDRPFKDVGEILTNMDEDAKKAIREVCIGIEE